MEAVRSILLLQSQQPWLVVVEPRCKMLAKLVLGCVVLSAAGISGFQLSGITTAGAGNVCEKKMQCVMVIASN